MYALISLEIIGADIPKHLPNPRKSWVARVLGTCATYGLRRQFVDYEVDYSQSNSVGSRGVQHWYLLDTGMYEVQEWISWKKSSRYFLEIDNRGYTHKHEKGYVLNWLQNHI